MTCLTADERTQLTKWLTEARQAYHNVSIGGMARVFVDQTGERVEYGPTNAAQLAKYIFTLEVRLGLADTGPATTWMV
jgi:hypothetical protein